MIIFGTGEKKLANNQQRKQKCPNCGEQGIAFHLFQKYFHLFWIPTIPIGKRKVAACEKCGAGYEDNNIPQDLKSELSYVLSETRTPPYMYSGSAIAVIGIALISYFSDGKTTFKHPSGKKSAEGKMIGDELDGEWIYWYENGNKESIQYYKKGIEDSTWTWWNEDGTINKTGGYKNGLYHGKWTFYYPDEKIKSIENYFENRLHDTSWYYHNNGELSAKGIYLRGSMEGHWKFWYESGKLNQEGNYEANSEVGQWLSYYEDGSKMLIAEYQDDAYKLIDYWDENGRQLITNGNGKYQTFFSSGQMESQGTITNGIYTDQWSFWYENGQLKEVGDYVQGEYFIKNSWEDSGNTQVVNGNGKYVAYYENGVEESKGSFLGGLKDGQWIFKNDMDSITSKVNYKNGKANGLVLQYALTGKLYCEGNAIDNLQDGIWKWYFQNGSKESEVNFVDGKKEGVQTFWNESERVVKREHYVNGELIDEEIVSN